MDPEDRLLPRRVVEVHACEVVEVPFEGTVFVAATGEVETCPALGGDGEGRSNVSQENGRKI